MSREYNRFGEWMKHTRERQGRTQGDIGARASRNMPIDAEGNRPGISASYVSNIETRKRHANPALAEAIAVALGKQRVLGLFMAGFVPPDWLQGDLEELESLFEEIQRLSIDSPGIVRSEDQYRRTTLRPGDAKRAGAWLRRQRREAGMTQEDLRAAMNPEKPPGERTLARWENGQARPGLRHCREIAKALGHDVRLVVRILYHSELDAIAP